MSKLVYKEKKILEVLANVSFYIFIFFIFFNTSLPFGEKGVNLDEVTTSNPVNQIVFGTLLLISLILLILKSRVIKEFAQKDVFLTVFTLWAFLTILWSNNPDVSFKRFLQYLATLTVPLAFFLHSDKWKESIKVFYHILIPYVLISILSVFATPLAQDFDGTWRGIHTDKNGFAQISIIALLIFAMHFKRSTKLMTKLFDLIFILTSFILIIGARSSTVFLALTVLILFWIISFLSKEFYKIGLRRFLLLFIIFAGIGINGIILYFLPEFYGPVVGALGKDLTFTGRVDLWADIWSMTKNYVIWGAGFRGFWVVDDPRLLDLYNIYVWIPIQAHSGYLDIINETGLIGFFLFLGFILKFFITAKLDHFKDLVWFMIIAIVINITESKFITPKAPLSVMCFYSYIYYILNKKKNPIFRDEKKDNKFL